MRLIADIDFNRDDDKKEFSTEDKVVRVTRFKDEEGDQVGFSFELGRKDDDTLNITFKLGELLTVIASCEVD